MDSTAQRKNTFEASDLARFCETDVATIYTWVKKGNLPHFRTPGGRMRFERSAVLDFLRRFHFPVAPELAAGRHRIIAIDEDTTWLARIRSALSATFDLSTYADPIDGLLAIGDAVPDAVVLDGGSRSFDARQCIGRIRAGEKLRHVRIVAFTAEGDDGSAWIHAGAAAHVAKPRVSELRVTLLRALT